MSAFSAFFRKIAHAGIHEQTPDPLIDRIVFSNLIYWIGTALNILLSATNFLKSYYVYLGLNGVYQLGLILGFYFNLRGKYLRGRILASSICFAGLFIAGSLQGPVIEIEHFFLPFSVLAFTMFYAEERRYSLLFLALGLFCYIFLVSQTGPWLRFDSGFGHYEFDPVDVHYNRFGYLTLLFVGLYALSNAFNRALKLIDEQRGRLFEERRLASLGSIACNVAHEINSPLAALDLQIYQLKSRLRGEDFSLLEVNERIERIGQTSRRISVIVRSLKFLSGRDESDPYAARSIGSLVELALDMSREGIAKSGIRLTVDLENPAELVSCRAVALSQVFLNLVNNAVDAVADLPANERWIMICSRREGDRLRVSVEDGGFISSPEVRQCLFQSFFTTKPPGKGTGLGLSISRDTMAEHKGALLFDSLSPHTRFVVEIPVAAVEIAPLGIKTPREPELELRP